MTKSTRFSVFRYPEWLNPDLYPFRGKCIEVDGHTIHYLDEGEGPVILFSHPAVAWSFMYRDFIRILRQDFRCIALDYPGFGFSIPAGRYGYTLREQSEVLESFILKLGLSNIILLGHDTGGPSAFHLARRQPEWFRGFILTDTVIFPAEEYPRINFMLRMLNTYPVQQINRHTNFIMRLTCRFGFFTKQLTAPERTAYLHSFDTPGKRDRIIRVLAGIRRERSFMKEVRNGFETVLKNHPALLIYGEKDPVTHMGIPDRIHRMLPQSERFLIKGEGHFPHEAAAGEMSGIIVAWMKKNGSRNY